MSEERDTTTFIPSSEGDGATTTSTEQETRALLIQRVILSGIIISIAAILVYLFIYLQLGRWQILVDAGGLVIGILCLSLAQRSVQRGRLDTAGYWVVATLLVTFGTSELVWADETPYNIVGGVLLILLIGRLVLQRHWGAWLVAIAGFLGIVWLINRYEPLPRYSAIAESRTVYFFDLGLTAILTLVAIWLVIRAFRVGTIRTRLLIAFTLMTLLPVIAITTGGVITGWQSGQQQAVDRLETAITHAEIEIKAWLETLHNVLSLTVIREEVHTDMVQLLDADASTPDPDQDARQKVRRLLEATIQETQAFEEMGILNLEGEVILSTIPSQEGLPYPYLDPNQAFLQHSQEEPFLQPPVHDPTLDRPLVVAGHPILDDQGRTVGILAGRANLQPLNDIVARASGLDETDTLYLVGSDHRLLNGESGATVDSEGVDTALETQSSGDEIYENEAGQSIISVYHWLPELDAAIITEQSQARVLRAIRTPILVNMGIAIIGSLIAVTASLLVTRSIADPLDELAQTASQVAAGDFARVVKVDREDEIGALAHAFNQMNVRLHELISNLEQRVTNRTQELEERSAYLRASAEVGRAASSILDPDQLIQQVVELIREWFNLYYVGLFLVDEAGEWAILRAGTGEAGQAMLARGHRLRVGQGMIGWSVAQAQARIALQAEADAVRTTNPELPDTRSEAALPLRSRGQVIGALTVQSDQHDAFNEETITVLQNLADQVAVALENARLYTESQAALETVRRAYSELSREAWIELLRTQPDLGFHSSLAGADEATDWRPDMKRAIEEGRTIQGNGTGAKGDHALSVPIKVRDVVIGVLDTSKPTEAGPWTPEEVDLLETLTERLGIALEGARLYQDAQRRAAREHFTRDITDKMRRATSVQDIVQTAVDELFDILGTSRAFVRLEANALTENEQETRSTVEAPADANRVGESQ